MNPSRRQSAFPKAVFETEHEFVDVLLPIFMRYTIKIATNKILVVADYAVKRRQALVNFVRLKP